jgi:hypothetical protein
LMRARNSTTSGDRLLTMRPALFLAVVDGSRSVAQNLGSHPYQGSARGLVSTGSQLRPAQRCTAGDRCEPLGSDGVWTKRGPGMPACGGSGAPRRGPRLARETPAGCPRQASPAWAIALLGGALAGSGPGTSPCIDGLSLVTGMVVPSTLRVQTTRTMVSAWAIWHHEPDRLRLGGRIRTRSTLRHRPRSWGRRCCHLRVLRTRRARLFPPGTSDSRGGADPTRTGRGRWAALWAFGT